MFSFIIIIITRYCSAGNASLHLITDHLQITFMDLTQQTFLAGVWFLKEVNEPIEVCVAQTLSYVLCLATTDFMNPTSEKCLHAGWNCAYCSASMTYLVGVSMRPKIAEMS